LTGERTAEGFYKTKKGMDQAISRAIAYADYADLVWCETGTPDLEFARKFAEAVHAKHPGKMLAYNCSPSFNWKKNLDDATIAKFQKELGAMGYKYVKRGMTAYVEKVQEPEFAARERGYSFVSHQQEVGTGYFDELTTVIQGGKSSVTALTGSTEEEQFH
jgi:isocitrate lyase